MVNLPQTLRRTVERHPVVRTALLGCGVVSSALYIAADIIGSLRYPGYSWLDQEFSELTAQGAPTRPLMIALVEVPYTLLVFALAGGLWTTADPKKGAAQTAAVGLAGYTVFGFTAGTITPMATREAMAAGDDTRRNAFHGPLTLVSDLCLMVSMAFAGELLDKRFRFYSYATIATLIAFGVATSFQIPKMASNQSTPWMGLVERVNIYASMLWVAVLAIAMLSAEEALAERTRRQPAISPQPTRRIPR